MGMSGGIRGCRGCQGCIGVASGLRAQPQWAPVQGPSTPTGSPGGVTYLAKAKEVTEMSSAGYYIDLELYFVTVFTFVSMPPHHIFLHVILTLSAPHATIVAISHLVEKASLQELLSATEFSMRLV